MMDERGDSVRFRTTEMETLVNIRKSQKSVAALAGAAALALILSACGGSNDLGGGTGGGGGESTSDPDDGGGSAAEGCEEYEEYGSIEGASVTLLSSIREQEAADLQATFDKFTECTGIQVVHNGIGEFENQVVLQAEGGNAPDLAIFPQPGLLTRMVDDGHVVPAPDAVEAKVDSGWHESWKAYGTVGDEFYAAPMLASVKSFVWYSPKAFAENGYEIPKTLDEMMDLTAQIAADHNESGARPWCAGIGSGDATGWPATDWLEDYVMRIAGVDVYDGWVTNDVPFNDPQILESLEAVGEILLNDEYVNGGFGDARSIATTTFNDGGLPILSGECFMYRMASFYEAQVPEGTDVSPEGDFFAFGLPGVDEGEIPLLVAGEFVGAFNDKPETQAVQAYMASDTFANIRVGLGGVTSANMGVDPNLASSPLLELAIELLGDQENVVRFDGSDMMPSAVGAGSFWTGMTAWIDQTRTSEQVLDDIQASWPAN